MEKELVWISKELKDTLENLDSGVIDHLDIKKLIHKLKDEVDTYTDDFEESVASFKRHSKRVKDKFKEVVDEEVESLYGFWEEQESKRAEVHQKLSSLKDKIKSTKDDLLELKKITTSIDIYGLDKLIEMVEKIKNMPPADKELLMHVFSHGKKQ